MSLKLYLLRHGETPYSQEGAFCGTLDAELTPEGHAMAQAFADAYSEIDWTDVYVSPMKRTIATAQPLCDAIGKTMQIRDGLKEINYGEWESQDLDHIKQNYEQDYIRWMTEPAWNAPTGGETSVQIANRALAVIAEIEAKYSSGGNILIVSHKATIRIIICSLLGMDIGRYRDRVNALAGSISVIKFATYGPMLEVLGDRHYLPQQLRDRAGT
ncbi:MAG: histidine phosphatase family protein [Methylococcales bacterium]